MLINDNESPSWLKVNGLYRYSISTSIGSLNMYSGRYLSLIAIEAYLEAMDVGYKYITAYRLDSPTWRNTNVDSIMYTTVRDTMDQMRVSQWKQG